MYLLSVVVVILFVKSEAAKILAVFPTPSISHHFVFRPFTQELAKRGHEVTVITPDPVFPKGGAPPNLTEIDVHDISYKIWQEKFIMKAPKGIENDLLKQLEVIISTFVDVFDAQLKTKEVQRLIKDKNHFDVLLLESCVRPSLVFSHIFKAPVILVSSLGAIAGNYELIGAPVHPLLYPSFFTQRLNNLTMWEKILGVYGYYAILKVYENNALLENKMLRDNFGSDTPSVESLENNVDMMFVNMHPVFEGNYPVPPSVIYMGGLHQNPRKELPKDLKSYLDSSKNGVIYISFGTNVDPSLLPEEKIQVMVKVLSELPYDVLFKWSKDTLPGRTENIRISKWLPQSDLLRHPKIKLFITQGGLQSTDEAITSGVPVIGIPMLGDQWFNVEKYVHHKIGMRLDLDNINKDNFRNAIETIIGDESYRQNILKLRSVILDQPQRPLDRIVWWTEYVIRHSGAKHLRAPAANISWAQYLEVELVLTLLGSLLILIALFVFIVFRILKFLSPKCKSKSD